MEILMDQIGKKRTKGPNVNAVSEQRKKRKDE